MATAWVFVDYQNVDHSAFESFTAYGQSEVRVDGVVGHILGETAYRASRDLHDYRPGQRRRR